MCSTRTRAARALISISLLCAGIARADAGASYTEYEGTLKITSLAPAPAALARCRKAVTGPGDSISVTLFVKTDSAGIVDGYWDGTALRMGSLVRLRADAWSVRLEQDSSARGHSATIDRLRLAADGTSLTASVRFELSPDLANDCPIRSAELLLKRTAQGLAAQRNYHLKAIGFPARLAIIKAELAQPALHETAQKLALEIEAIERGPESGQQVTALYARRQAVVDKLYGPQSVGAAANLMDWAYELSQRGWVADAVAVQERVVPLLDKLYPPDHPVVGGQSYALATYYLAEGRYESAWPLLVRSLELAKAEYGETSINLINRLSEIAAYYRSEGRLQDALTTFQRALKIAVQDDQRLQVKSSVSAWLTGSIGLIEIARGEYNAGWAKVQESFATSQALASADARDHMRMSAIYRQVDQLDPAAEQAELALKAALRDDGPEHPRVAECLMQLADIAMRQGRTERATAHLEKALSIREKRLGKQHPLTAETMRLLSELLADRDQLQRAQTLALRAWQIGQTVFGPWHPSVMRDRVALGAILVRLGADPASSAQQRLAYLEQANRLLRGALTLGTLAESRLSQVYAQRAYARNERLSGRPRSAIFHGKLAVMLTQAIRGDARQLDGRLQRGLMQANRETYQDLADWLIEDSRLDEAEDILAMLKDQELFELVQQEGKGPRAPGLTREEADLATEWKTLGEQGRQQQAQNLLRDRRLRQALDPQAEGLGPVDMADWSQQFSRWIDKVEQVLAPGAAANSGGAATPKRLRDILESPAAAGAVALQYVVSDKRLSVIITTRTGSTAVQVPVKRSELVSRIERVRVALSQAVRDPRPDAQWLYQQLIAPIKQHLARENPNTLLLSLSDALRYLPFAVLHDGKNYLIEHYALANYTPSAGERPGNSDPGKWQITGLGTSQAVSGFSALPAVRSELQTIVRTPENPSGLIQGQVYLDNEFDRSRLIQAAGQGTPVLHLASHFQFTSGSEQASFLVLGNGDRFSLAQIKNLEFRKIELLALSACNTGTGGGISDSGAEVEGLGAVVQRAGVNSVLATLWPVADASTSQWMQRFYALRSGQKLPTAQAMRQVQREFLDGTALRKDAPGGTQRALIRERRDNAQLPVYTHDPLRPWAHPYYWAPFVLMGNWD